MVTFLVDCVIPLNRNVSNSKGLLFKKGIWGGLSLISIPARLYLSEGAVISCSFYLSVVVMHLSCSSFSLDSSVPTVRLGSHC